MELTKNADKVLCHVYKMYLKRMKEGVPMIQAVEFDYDFYKEEKALSQMEESALDMALIELKNTDYIKSYTDGGFVLKSTAIAFMERKFSNDMKQLLSYISSLSKLIP